MYFLLTHISVCSFTDISITLIEMFVVFVSGCAESEDWEWQSSGLRDFHFPKRKLRFDQPVVCDLSLWFAQMTGGLKKVREWTMKKEILMFVEYLHICDCLPLRRALFFSNKEVPRTTNNTISHYSRQEKHKGETFNISTPTCFSPFLLSQYTLFSLHVFNISLLA